ncbi:MAG: polyprenyl synthetase family protein [Capsulimonadaceae bacterium]
MTDLFEFLQLADRDIRDYLDKSSASQYFHPAILEAEVWSYIRRPAKRLRPAVLLMACGSVGGDLSKAIPAAAGIEVYHTWTLVHDDLIDNDSVRRGSPTVHISAAQAAMRDLNLSRAKAEEYGRDIAVLVGDAQNGWATTLFADCALVRGVDSHVILHLIQRLQSYVLGNLVCGETLDVEFSLVSDGPEGAIDEDAIVNMLWLKTGILYEFAGTAGAMIGKNTSDIDDVQVAALANFAGKCGTAFQLQDDILGILGDARETGKPVGSDIREGKMTVIVFEALKNAKPGERDQIMAVLGDRQATDEQVHATVALLRDLGGVDRTDQLARSYIRAAIPSLDAIDASQYKDLLVMWADFMVNRRF